MKEKDIRYPTSVSIKPSIQFNLDPQFSSTVLVAGDLNGDGQLELVTARNQDQNITAVAAYTIQGQMLWTWGIPGTGLQKMTYDLPLQIIDINADGQNELVLCADHAFIVLNGSTGKEIIRHPLPEGLEVIDCITFGNLQGHTNKPYPPDIIIKSRYKQLWAYSANWTLLWTFIPKRDWKTCHHPTLMDIDGDGKDEVFAGFEMLDHDGKVLWSIQSPYLRWRQFRGRGHLDCVRIINKGKMMEEWKFALTYCSSNFLGVINGLGKVIWQKKGHHFESLDVGFFSNQHPFPQIFVDIDHLQYGKACSHFYDLKGNLFCKIGLNYGRQHRCVDWNGDGLDEVVIASPLAIVNGQGDRIANLEFKGPGTSTHGYKETAKDHELIYVSILDISGKGNGDIVLHSNDSVCIFLNQNGKPNSQQRWDTTNLTYY